MITHQAVTVLYSNSPGHTEIVIITTKIGDIPSFNNIKQAIIFTEDYLNSEIIIPRPCSDYDCTGLSFTSHIERINCSIHKGTLIFEENSYFLISIYEHTIRIDV